MLTIRKNEPDGWDKAWEVCFIGRHIAFFHFRDSAVYFIRQHFAENQ